MGLAVGVIVVSLVLLREAGALLGQLHAADGRSFGASAFTAGRWPPADTAPLNDAVAAWTYVDPSSPHDVEVASRAGEWVTAHLFIDMLAFAPMYLLLLSILLRRLIAPPGPVGSASRWWRWGRTTIRHLPVLLFLVELAEGVATFLILKPSDWPTPPAGPVWLIPVLSSTKSALLVLIIVVMAVAYVRRRELRAEQRTRIASYHAGNSPQSIPGVLAGVIGTLVLFALLVAVPAGGPLEQIPDVVRAQLEEFAAAVRDNNAWAALSSTLVLSCLSVLALAMAVGAASWLATSLNPPAPDPCRHVLRDAAIGVGLAAAALVLPIVLPTLHGDPAWGNASSYALTGTILAILLLSWAARGLVSALRPPGGDDEAETPPNEPDPEGWESKRRGWIAGLAAAIVALGALGLVRAVAPGVLLGSRRYIAALIVGALVSVVVVPLAVAVSSRRLVGRAARRVLPVGAAAALGAAVWLTARPWDAGTVGTVGALAIATTPILLVVSLLAMASRRFAWRPTADLGLGPRTPWLAILVCGWLVASTLDSTGGYHDARLRPVDGMEQDELLLRDRTLDAAFTSWATATRSVACSSDSVRMLLVAAPGGGIRAAYWTALGLDALAERCPADLFAVSGVSGGAVGTIATLSGEPGGGAATVASMSQDDALAAGVAALMLRDLPQPLTATRTGWADRAAVFEDRWIATGDVFESVDDDPKHLAEDDPKLFMDVGNTWSDTTQYRPVIMLGGSSVNDGCRAIVSNVAGLPGSRTDCAGARIDRPPGVLTRSLDLRTDLVDPFEGGTTTDWNERWSTSQPNSGDDCSLPVTEDRPELTAVTAALLAARFPYVSPSGALRRCLLAANAGKLEVSTTYVVDGGYYENHGLHALLETWQAVAPSVEVCNEAAGRQRSPEAAADEEALDPPIACPMRGDERLFIEPAIVVLHASYRSEATATSKRPKELFVPPGAFLGHRGELLSDTTLEQAAALAMETAGQRALFWRFGLTTEPGLTAPLGWVLSDMSRATMCADMREQVENAPFDRPNETMCSNSEP